MDGLHLSSLNSYQGYCYSCHALVIAFSGYLIFRLLHFPVIVFSIIASSSFQDYFIFRFAIFSHPGGPFQKGPGRRVRAANRECASLSPP
jgi:hypothetical protein